MVRSEFLICLNLLFLHKKNIGKEIYVNTYNMSSKLSPEATRIISILRALVNSRKQPCLLQAILKDFQDMEGYSLPYKKFEFKTAEELFQKSKEFIISRANGEILVSVKCSKESAHITSMIKSQKKGKPQKKSPQFRTPRKSDHSWNKTSMSYSSIQYPKMPNDKSRNSEQKFKNGQQHNQLRTMKQNVPISTYNFPEDKRILLNKKNDQQLQVDLRDRLIAKRTGTNIQQQEQQQKQQPRPILGCQNTTKHSIPSTQSSKIAPSPIPPLMSLPTPKLGNQCQSQIQLTTSNAQHKIKINRNNTNNNNSVTNTKSSIQDRLRIKLPIAPTQEIAVRHEPGNIESASSSDSKFPLSRCVENISTNQFLTNQFLTKFSESVIKKDSKEMRADSTAPNVFEFSSHISPLRSLEQYCMARHSPRPEYKIFKSKFSGKFQCRVHVNDSIYSTYPEEYETEDLAKLACASQAIEEIKGKEARNRYPMCMDSDNELISKIHMELKKHPSGIFAKNMSEWFESTFKQSPPDHWWSLVQGSNLFELSVATHSTIVFAKTNISDSPNCNSVTSSPLPTENEFIVIDRISLPWENKFWNLHITHCVSTIEVWGRLFGPKYSEQLDNLLTDIDVHMLTEKTRPVSITCGCVYLVCLSECWHRVRVDDVDKLGNKCLCIFLDFGDDDWIPADQIYICETKFLRFPPQAVVFSLFGLEDFAENPIAKRHIEKMLTGKSLVAEILTSEDTFESMCSEGKENELKIQVVLYDTSSDEDINLNPLIMDMICKDTPPPELKRNGVTNVNITNVNNDGDIYLQVRNSELLYIQKLIQNLVASKFNEDIHKIDSLSIGPSHIYLVRDVCDNRWYRAVCSEKNIQKKTGDTYDMFYVDFGIQKTVQLQDIFCLESLSAALANFPRQALKTKLHNMPPLSSDIVARIRGLLPPDSPAIVKMVSPGEVIFYKRFEGNQNLFNVNDCIRIEYELESSSDCIESSRNNKTMSPVLNDRMRNFSLKTSPITVPNSPQRDSLPRLKEYEDIPPEGEYFDVAVAMSSNPFNFTIQPYNDYQKLMELMTELQQHCENNEEIILADMLEVGQAYAAQNSDGYYRVTVENIFSPTMIHVCFCDYGNISVVSNTQLKSLPAKFRQLPKQALQAKLYGIKPIDNDWTLDDCLRFEKLTVGGKFVSVIKRITYDEISPDTKILELELIDVTTKDDIYIHQYFLDEGRAAPTPQK